MGTNRALLSTTHKQESSVETTKKVLVETNKNSESGRQLQMDRKKNCWLVENGKKRAISFREIAEKFDSYQKGVLKKLRAGIESGADLATVAI